jgi:hypothetical protein
MDYIVDITGEAFARRLGNLLTHHRERYGRERYGRERCGRDGSGISLGAMARRSNGHFTRRQLRQFEAADGALDAVTVSALANLYGIDIESILAERTDIAIDPGGSTISAGGVHATFDADDPRSLLETYLRLVRRLRDQERDEIVELRREDIEGLAEHLDEPGESVVQQLGTLMGATRTQRRAMAGMFIAGALIITVAVPSVAAVTGGDSPTAFDVTPGSPSVDVVEVIEVVEALDEIDPANDVLHDVDGPARRERPTENGVVLEDLEPVHHVAPEVTEATEPPADTSPAGTPPADTSPAETPEPVEVHVAPPPVPTAPTVAVDPVPTAVPDVEPGVEPGAEPEVAVGPPPVPAAPDEIVEPGPGPVMPVAEPVSP